MAVEVDSKFGEIADRLVERAEILVEKTTMDVEAKAKANLIAQDSVDTGHTLGSIEGLTLGFFHGEVSVGASTAIYIELGTGVRGEAYEFPGKPDDVTYEPTWTRGIPKDPMHGFAFLIPAVESQRPDFNHAVGQLIG